MMTIGHGEHGYKRRPPPERYSGRLRRLPRWARMYSKRLTLFSYEERLWRVISYGSHNNTPERERWGSMTRKEKRVGMFVEYAVAVPTDVEEVKLEAGGSTTQFVESLMRVQAQGRRFTPDMLRVATHVKWWKP